VPVIIPEVMLVEVHSLPLLGFLRSVCCGSFISVAPICVVGLLSPSLAIWTSERDVWRADSRLLYGVDRRSV
jgi:hypothetical protein